MQKLCLNLKHLLCRYRKVVSKAVTGFFLVAKSPQPRRVMVKRRRENEALTHNGKLFNYLRVRRTFHVKMIGIKNALIFITVSSYQAHLA